MQNYAKYLATGIIFISEPFHLLQINLNGNPWNSTAPDIPPSVDLQTKQSFLIKTESIHCVRYCCKSFILKQLADLNQVNQLICCLCVCLPINSTLRMIPLGKNCVFHGKEASTWPPDSVRKNPKSFRRRTITSNKIPAVRITTGRWVWLGRK